jgi:serine/threonine protein kinase
MEFKESQTLDIYLCKRFLTISLWSKIRILLNIVFGMKHLINYKIVHLDLKPTNILICKFLITKIIDFG